MRLTPVEPGNRIELPAEWAAELGLDKFAALEKTSEGILVHSCPTLTWDKIFLTKLTIGRSAAISQTVEATGDALVL